MTTAGKNDTPEAILSVAAQAAHAEFVALFHARFESLLNVAIDKEISDSKGEQPGSVLHRVYDAYELHDLGRVLGCIEEVVADAQVRTTIIGAVSTLLATHVVNQWLHETQKYASGFVSASHPKGFVSAHSFSNDLMLVCGLDDFWDEITDEFTFMVGDQDMPLTMGGFRSILRAVRNALPEGEFLPACAAVYLRETGVAVKVDSN